MKLLLSKPRGFCAGVLRAIETVDKALEMWGAPIYVKHEIVHNRHVVNKLCEKGAIFIEDLDLVPEGARIIYSAHGVHPDVRKQAKERKLIEIDATCGLVTRVHSAIKRYAKLGYHIILIGHKNHVEVVGSAGEAYDKTVIVESLEDVKNLNFGVEDKLFYVTQTTLSLDDVEDITNELKRLYPQIKTLSKSSICYATTNRQLALRNIAAKTDVVFVVGDTRSSNSNRLKEAALKQGVRAYLINDSGEIRSEWLKNVDVIGLTAGASTPENIVQQCIQRLREFGVCTVEDVIYVEENVTFGLPKL